MIEKLGHSTDCVLFGNTKRQSGQSCLSDPRVLVNSASAPGGRGRVASSGTWVSANVSVYWTHTHTQTVIIIHDNICRARRQSSLASFKDIFGYDVALILRGYPVTGSNELISQHSKCCVSTRGAQCAGCSIPSYFKTGVIVGVLTLSFAKSARIGTHFKDFKADWRDCID
ncbi:hypothetical protein J6590_022468 [Homalodisca vitripennis]|nr:hypothetical protein J6590_099333 [Homalodisca vitripennis]KAG8337433.1 hypothetical protein J6590_022468 [Homalodisca vitripennis]